MLFSVTIFEHPMNNVDKINIIIDTFFMLFSSIVANDPVNLPTGSVLIPLSGMVRRSVSVRILASFVFGLAPAGGAEFVH